MGFLDKAKKLAEQAQTKIDEVQKDFNAKQGGDQPAPGAAVEYDQQGRPVTPDPPPTPVTPETPASSDPAPNRPHGDPLQTGEDASRHGADADRGEHPDPPPPSGGPSGMTSGDPLGG
jgi:hypothetical protein